MERYKVFLGVYVFWETGDISVWKGIAQDALIMNIDDLLCVGATDNIYLPPSEEIKSHSC
jgi:hypothetical protein